MPTTQTFDISIIGAGVVGVTAAIALAQKGHHIALLAEYDLFKTQQNNNSLDTRSIALSLSSKQILQYFDCWQMLHDDCQVINDIHVSSKGHWGVTRINKKHQHCDALGYVIESHLLEAALIKKLNSFKNIHIFHSAQYQRVQHNDNGCLIELIHNKSDIQLQSQLCLICDGAQSKAREQAGFSVQQYDYQQIAIATHVSGQHLHNTTAYERFTAQGPLAMLPLTQGRYGLVWSHHSKRSQQLMAMNDADFLTELHKDFGYRLGHITQVGKRVAFPLIKRVSATLTQQRYVVLGNAAHNLHPVAGQSLNLALRDIAHLTDALSDLTHVDEQLNTYQQQRQKDHQQVIELGDNLVNIFSNNMPVLNHARSAALALLDIMPAIKSNFTWRGMGFAQPAATAQRGQYG